MPSVSVGRRFSSCCVWGAMPRSSRFREIVCCEFIPGHDGLLRQTIQGQCGRPEHRKSCIGGALLGSLFLSTTRCNRPVPVSHRQVVMAVGHHDFPASN